MPGLLSGYVSNVSDRPYKVHTVSSGRGVSRLSGWSGTAPTQGDNRRGGLHMPYQTWIFDAAKATGYPVVEVAGWETRGSSTFNPAGLVWHHTAGASSGDAPTLSLVVNGRSDLPGPLSQFVLGRSGTIYVVAAGRANHAGEGGWRGLSGNASVFGIEAEHTGRSGTPWPAAQLGAYLELSVELCKRGGFDESMVCGHKEWAPFRKIDPIDLDMDDMRRRIAQAMEDDMNPVPQPDWLPDSVIDRLMAEKVITVRPVEEPLVIWRMYVFQDRTLTAAKRYADSVAGADEELRAAYNTHRHPGLLSPAPRPEDKV